MNTFPWRKYTTQELDKEYTKLQNKVNEPIKFPIPRSIIGYYCSNVFSKKKDYLQEELQTAKCLH